MLEEEEAAQIEVEAAEAAPRPIAARAGEEEAMAPRRKATASAPSTRPGGLQHSADNAVHHSEAAPLSAAAKMGAATLEDEAAIRKPPHLLSDVHAGRGRIEDAITDNAYHTIVASASYARTTIAS